MEILELLIPLALILGLFFIGLFLWAIKKGHYDDLETPRFTMLLEEENTKVKKKNTYNSHHKESYEH